MTQDIVQKAEHHAKELIDHEFSEDLTYHNLPHVESVVRGVRQLAIASGVSESVKNQLEVAAWFHDLGYAESTNGHEAIGARMAEKFLRHHGANEDEISYVKKVVLATQPGASPSSLGEQIIQDADMAHFAAKDYSEFMLGLRNELSAVLGKTFTDEEWLEENISFLKNHSFNTDAANNLFLEGKQKNLRELKKLRKQIRADEKKRKAEIAMAKKSTEKGRETVFRVTLRNHMQLSKIADNKANIMLSVNAIIVSVILGSLLPAAEDDHVFRVPLLVLLFTCVATIVMAAISTIPQVTEGKYSREDVTRKKVNLLFFGNFHAAPLDEYQWGMEQLLNDEEYLYSSLSKDLYFLGKVLHRKYKFLRYTYLIFMTGMLATVIATVVNYL